MKPEILKLLRGWLDAFGASVNDEGRIINKDGLVLQTRITTTKGGQRMMIVGGGDGSVLLFSGPLAQDALHAFVSKFWYWETQARWEGPGLFILAKDSSEMGMVTRILLARTQVGGSRTLIEKAYKSIPPLTQEEIVELIDTYRRKDKFGNVWQLYMEGEKLYEVCHELMEADTYNRMFGNKVDD